MINSSAVYQLSSPDAALAAGGGESGRRQHGRLAMVPARCQRILTRLLTAANDAAGVQKQSMRQSRKPAALPRREDRDLLCVTRGVADSGLARGVHRFTTLTPTRTQLLASLNDNAPEIVKAVAEALAYMNGEQVQPSLLSRGLDERRRTRPRSDPPEPGDERQVLWESFERAADRRFAEVSGIDPEPRGAHRAAEARGALNLPAEQAKALIVKEGTP